MNPMESMVKALAKALSIKEVEASLKEEKGSPKLMVAWLSVKQAA